MKGWNRKAIGAEGERLAADYLRKQSGYRMVAVNWRCRSGELDMVAEFEERIVFVEVRSRRMTGTFGTPLESVDYRKQNQVRETAQIYLHQHRLWDRAVRFDVISVWFDTEGAFLQLDHVQGAF